MQVEILMIELAKLKLSDGFRKAEKGKNVKALKLKLICSAQKLQGIATNPASTIPTKEQVEGTPFTSDRLLTLSEVKHYPVPARRKTMSKRHRQ